MKRKLALAAALLLAPAARADMFQDGSNAAPNLRFEQLNIGISAAPLSQHAPLTILTNPASNPAGVVSGVKIGVDGENSPAWATNPYAGHFVALYTYINSKNGRDFIWASNPLAEVSGTGAFDAQAWTIEADMSNYGSEVDTPGTAGHKIIVAAVSGGAKRSTVAFNATASLRDGSNWNYTGLHIERAQNYGIWFHKDALDTAPAFIGASIYDDSDSFNILRAIGSHANGIHLTDATFSGAAFQSPGFTVDGTGQITSGAVALYMPNLSTIGVGVATLCIDAVGKVFKKAGPCF